MIKRYKSGFSLVEVMLLLLVLSLIISASIPMITKRNLAIPQKAIHGMYQCIAKDNGKFYTARYNSKKLISEKENADSCDEFIPPKTTGLFNIYLYGAGAGGYNYYNVTSQEYTRSATYNMGDGELPTFGDYIYAVTDSDIGEAFKGQTVYLSATLPGGYAGGDITAQNMSSASNVCCSEFYKSSTGTRNSHTLSGYPKQSVRGYSLLSEDDKSKIREMCTTYFSEHKDEYDCTTYDCHASNGYTDITLSGGSGGRTSYINYSYDIPKIQEGGSWVNWLKRLADSHSTDLKYTIEGSPGDDKDLGNKPSSGGEAEYGTNPEYTATITSYFGTVQNIYSATNGEPASISITSSKISAPVPNNGESAAERSSKCEESISYGSCSISSSSSSGEPYFKLTSTTYEHTHSVGRAGNAGESKKVTIKNLPSPCRFTVSKGGDIVQSGGESYSLPATTIVCGSNCNTAGNCYSLSAQSGSPNLEIVSQTFPYPYDTAPYTITGEQYSKVKTQDVNFNKLSTWYKFAQSNSSIPGVGFGGNGPIIIDNCTEINGTLDGSTYRNSSSIKTVINKSKEAACKLPSDGNGNVTQTSGTWSIQTPASKGGGGAVVIVW